MTTKCLLDTLPARTGGMLCWRHHDQIARMLDPSNWGDAEADIPASIPVMYRILNPRPTSGTTGRRAPGYASKPSANLTAVVMRDNRSQVGSPRTWYDPHPSGFGDDETRPHVEDDETERAIRKAIVSLAEVFLDRWHLNRGEDNLATWQPYEPAPPPPLPMIGPELPNGEHYTTPATTTALLEPRTLTGGYYGPLTAENACAWLHTRVLDLTAEPDADWVFDDLLELSDQIRPAIGDPNLAPVGECSEMVHENGPRSPYRECGCPLYLPPPQRDREDQTPDQALRETVVTCRRCHRPYRWLDLIRLRQAQSA